MVMAKKHYGNLDIYGVVTVGADISASKYTLPHAIGSQGDSIVVVGGVPVFTNVAPYVDIAQVSGGAQLVGDVNFLIDAVNSISGAVDTFAELLDTPKPVSIVDSHEGEIIIVDPNASMQAQKIKYSGVVLSDLVYDVNYLISVSGSQGGGVGDITWATVAAVSGGLDDRIYTLERVVEDTNEPTGFVNRTSSTLTYDTTGAIFSIVGNHDVYVDGVRMTKPSNTFVMYPSYGTHFLKYAYPGGAFNESTTAWDLTHDAPIAYVFFNSSLTDSFVGEERHGITMDGVTHSYLHNTIGAKYKSGLSLTGYGLNSDIIADNKYGVTSGSFYDEDIINNIPALPDNGPYNIFYKTGALGHWTWSKSEIYPYFINANVIRYNENTGSTWQLTNVPTNGTWVNYYVLATNSITPGFETIIIAGQTMHTSLSSAEAESISNLDLTGLPFQETVAVAKVIHQRDNTFNVANGYSRIVEVTSLIGQSVTNQGIPSHNTLLGLQGGTSDQRYHISQSQYTDFIGKTEVAAISGGLNTKIDSINLIGIGTVTIVESPVNVFTVSISADVGSGPDVTEKLIPIASALLPAISGADLSSRTTAGGMIFDSVDFAASYEVAHFNFPMSENFNLGSTVYLKMKMIAGAAGTADFLVTFEDLSNTDNWTTATGHTTIPFTHTFSGAGVIENESITVTSPTYHNIKQGDLVIISVRRVGGSLLGDASIVSMKLAW
jgi:hypothetical protein